MATSDGKYIEGPTFRLSVYFKAYGKVQRMNYINILLQRRELNSFVVMIIAWENFIEILEKN